MVVEEESWSEKYEANHVLTLSSIEKKGENYWLTRSKQQDYFILDLGCSAEYNTIQLVNTHNAVLRDKSTLSFRVSLGDKPDPDWEIIRKENKVRQVFLCTIDGLLMHCLLSLVWRSLGLALKFGLNDAALLTTFR